MSLHDSIQPTEAGPPSAVERKLGVALLVIATAQLMLVLDDTIVNVALPSMQRSLHIPTSHLNWIASFYALNFGGLLLAGGRLGDMYGRIRMFRHGIIVFALASMAGGFAPNETALLIARLVQGCGAAIAAPGALSLLTTTFPPGPARTKAIGIYGSMAGVGSVVGLLLGGVLTAYVSWRWVLFINVPIAVVVLIGSRLLIPGDSEGGSLDLIGAVTVTLGIGSIVFGLTSGNTNGWNAPVTLACFGAGAVLLAAFVMLERTRRTPLVPPEIVRDRSRAGAYIVMLMLGAGTLAMFYLLTLYMQIVRGYSPIHRSCLSALRRRHRYLRKGRRAQAARKASCESRDCRRAHHLCRCAHLVRLHPLANVRLLRGDPPNPFGRVHRNGIGIRGCYRRRSAWRCTSTEWQRGRSTERWDPGGSLGWPERIGRDRRDRHQKSPGWSHDPDSPD